MQYMPYVWSLRCGCNAASVRGHMLQVIFRSREHVKRNLSEESHILRRYDRFCAELNLLVDYTPSDALRLPAPNPPPRPGTPRSARKTGPTPKKAPPNRERKQNPPENGATTPPIRPENAVASQSRRAQSETALNKVLVRYEG